jgi:hypothetical protein
MKGECRCGSIVENRAPTLSEGMDRRHQPTTTGSGVVRVYEDRA